MNIPTIEVTAYGETMTLTPNFGRYGQGRLAITFDCDEGPYGTLTTNLPNEHLNDNEVFVKYWSENGPLFEALLDAGWIVDTGREVMSGYVSPKVMRLAGALAEFKAQFHMEGE
jgi:hypothetical protein